MPVHVNVAVPAEHFVLRRVPADTRIELERCVPFANGEFQYLWIADADEASEWEATAIGDGGVKSVARIDGERLVRAECRSGESAVFDALLASEATCLSGFRDAGAWNLTLRFPSAAAVSKWYRTCPEAGTRVTVQRVQPGVSARSDRSSVLTDAQGAALRTALETGYFAVPRRISLRELADRHGVSDTAISQRLRRGTERLLVERFGDIRR
ncbi:bacterio-opsin activator HTH domain-containing protein [Halorubrum aidingense JCM 13560]|uniref:Bacterio-opsin activator HTH domain-containing protein n=1 Tax=Halorubrum aidingense JCM 13560 TaxID=1230454 RepID=M0PKW3_9EURY|nr:helix-turn-helix domain-containing protein [Halorubrum aidingense]EMA70667.1 bacterio-opsin activator HTH domain-containing protein [Halorubrum aidingense JCM 13560]